MNSIDSGSLEILIYIILNGDEGEDGELYDLLVNRFFNLEKVNEFDYIDYEHASIIEKKSALWYFVASWLYNDFRDYNVALSHANACISLSPDNAWAYELRALANSRLGFYSESLNDYLKCTEIGIMTIHTHMEHGNSMRALKNYVEAVQSYTSAIEVSLSSLDNWEPYNLRARIKELHLGDYHGALEDYNKAIELKPESQLLHANRARLIAMIGRVQEGS